jgi:hypothetical protein
MLLEMMYFLLLLTSYSHFQFMNENVLQRIFHLLYETNADSRYISKANGYLHPVLHENEMYQF